MQKRGFANGPLVRSEKKNISSTAVEFVRLAGMYGLFLNVFNLEVIHLLIEQLRQIHRDALVYLLPQVCMKNLYERYFERRDLAVHENASQIQLNLKSNVHVCAVDGWAPPEGESSIWYLTQAGTLRVGQFLMLLFSHAV